MSQWVTVRIEHDDNGVDMTVKGDGIFLTLPKIESVDVYGPFDTEREAKADARKLKEMGGLIYVREIESPESETEG